MMKKRNHITVIIVVQGILVQEKKDVNICYGMDCVEKILRALHQENVKHHVAIMQNSRKPSFHVEIEVSNMREISEDELNKNIDEYFNIAENEVVIVSLENNKKIIMMSEKKYNNLKVGD